MRTEQDVWRYRPGLEVSSDLTGFSIEALDGGIGKIDESSMDVGDQIGKFACGNRIVADISGDDIRRQFDEHFAVFGGCLCDFHSFRAPTARVIFWSPLLVVRGSVFCVCDLESSQNRAAISSMIRSIHQVNSLFEGAA